MDYFYWYRKVLLQTVRVVAILFVAVSAILLMAISLDLLFHLHWGYPWWSILVALIWIILGCLVSRAATIALRHLSPSSGVD